MSRYDNRATNRAVALRYEGEGAPVVVASGMGYLAERMIEVAAESGVPIYEDNSLSTILTQLKLGQEIPEELYKAIVEIYVYFLHFDPNKVKEGGQPKAAAPAGERGAQAEQEE